MSKIAHLDFETFSAIDIRKVGAHRYARHPSTEVLIACYWLPGMTGVATWLPLEDGPPEDLVEYVESGQPIGAHNANFERLVWQHALKRQHPELPLIDKKQWVCTAAKAAASGLPRSLDKALMAAGCHVKKNPEGTRLIKIFSVPRKPTKKDASTRVLPSDRPDEFLKFIAYCIDDVKGEMALDAALPDLRPRERMFFRLDMLMNDRGLPIDIPLVKSTLTVLSELERRNLEEAQALTGGIKASQVAKMLELLEVRGLSLDNLRAETIRVALKDQELDKDTRRLLELRVEGSKASTKKLQAMMLCADPTDHVVQGGFLYHGAHTARYSGRLVQPHNFIRGNLKDWQRDQVFELLRHGDADLLAMLYEKPIDVISQCMRGYIKAPEGQEFYVVDYTAIEARLLAWLTGENEILEAYRKGLDVYKVMAAKLWKIGYDEVSDEQRRIGKNLVLGCGYSLGGLKFVDYCANLGLVIEPEFAMSAVRTYRKEHPNIVASWKTVENLVVDAIRNPGKISRGLKCRFFMREHWLCVELPGGRELRYPYAKAVPVLRYDKPAYEISFATEYMGQWTREKTYGGKLIENIVQAIARDVMMEGMYNAEKAGYPVIGTVHDEIITQRDVGTGDIKALELLVCDVPEWADGMPLASKGFVCDRYKKD
ncbi:MAG: DNA polymerase [Betaproteobacteria bacterium]